MKVIVNNTTYLNFSSIDLSRSLDSVASTFSLSAYFDTENKEQIRALLPLEYQEVVIKDNEDKILLTGEFLNTGKDDLSESSLVAKDGYSKCGVLMDVNVPININSLQSNGLTLKEITEKLIQPYGLKLIINENSLKKANEKIGRTYTYMNEELDRYICNLALTKNIVVSHNENGDLVFLSIDKDVKSKYSLTTENTIGMNLRVDGQNMHSEISATRQLARRNRKNPTPAVNSFVIKNPLIKKHRPKNNRTNMNQNTDLSYMAKSFYMEELENISVDISFANYFSDLNVGDFVEVTNPHIFIFKPARMLVKTVNVNVTESGSSMSITCVIPETYTGETPKNIFEL